MMANSAKPMEFTVIHQLTGQSPITVYINIVVTAYRMGINQLKPIAPRIPDDKCAVGLLRGPSSESMTIAMAISVDEPNNNIPPKLELITPCQS